MQSRLTSSQPRPNRSLPRGPPELATLPTALPQQQQVLVQPQGRAGLSRNRFHRPKPKPAPQPPQSRRSATSSPLLRGAAAEGCPRPAASRWTSSDSLASTACFWSIGAQGNTGTAICYKL